MRKLNGDILFAAHDLECFLGCSRAACLDVRDPAEPLPKSRDEQA
jgi:hypothetical protein